MKKLPIAILVFCFAGSFFIKISNANIPVVNKNLYDQGSIITEMKKGGKSYFSVNESDSLALVALYNSTNGDIWRNKENWLVGPVSTWDGITVTDGRVTGIDLGMNNMIGQLPSEIGNLNKLRVLKFHNNDIHGSIPPEIGSLDSLRVLFLYSNDLEVSIPSEIGNLSELQDLRLSSNQLIGSIPEEIYNLTNLELLILSHNELTGSLSPAVGNLTKLTNLGVSNNQLEDSIPSEVTN